MTKIQVYDIAESDVVWRFLVELAKNSPQKFVRLTEDNTQRFSAILGKPKWQNNENKNFPYAWEIKENGLNLIVMTGASGTSFQIIIPNNFKNYLSDVSVNVGIISFIKKYSNLLLGE